MTDGFTEANFWAVAEPLLTAATVTRPTMMGLHRVWTLRNLVVAFA
ncbi:hypothetical protein [Mycobacterium sp. E2733]|nr:hypothetical protein [Mycobacterium sp. E2733]